MGAKEAMEAMMLQKGVKIFSGSYALTTIGPIDDELLRWLEYIPREEKERYDRLKLKENSLNKGEKRWLNQIELEARIASYIRTPGKLAYNQAYEFKEYMDNVSIDKLIARKLTDEEYELGQKIAQDLIENLNEWELRDLYHEIIDYYDEFDMVEAFAFREFGKVAIQNSSRSRGRIYAKKIRDNDTMRARSIIEAGKRVVG